MKKTITIVLALAMLAFCFAGCAPAAPAETSAPAETAETSAAADTSAVTTTGGADGSLQTVLSKGEFILGLDVSFPPYGYNDNGEIVGFDIDLAKEVCKRIGVELKCQPINWDTKVAELNNGNIDCIWNGFTITDDLKKEVLFTEPYVENRQIIVVGADSDIAAKADLADKVVGVQNGSSANEAIDAEEDVKNTFAELVQIDDNVSALMELKNGTVDAVVLDQAVGMTYVNDEPETYKVLDEDFGGEEYGIGFRLTDIALMEAVQSALDDMRKDGTFAEIVADWPDVTGAIAE